MQSELKKRFCSRSIRGLKTAWSVYGAASSNEEAGPIVFLFHGFPDSPETWDSQLSVFGKDSTLVVPYLRGTGPSEATSDVNRYRKDALVLDYLEILEEVDPSGKRPVILVGHDLGGISAWEMGYALQDRVKAIVMIATVALEVFWNRRTNPEQMSRSWYMWAMQVPGVAESAFKWFGKEIATKAYTKGGLSEDQMHWNQLRQNVPGTIPHYRGGLADLLHLDPDRPRMKAPVLAIYGDKDPYLLAANEDEWRSYAQNIEIHILETGHWPHREQRETVNRLIQKFLEGLK